MDAYKELARMITATGGEREADERKVWQRFDDEPTKPMNTDPAICGNAYHDRGKPMWICRREPNHEGGCRSSR